MYDISATALESTGERVANSFGEIKVDKENGNARSRRRIDPADAAIDAHVIGMKQIATTIDVDSSINKFLEWMG